MSDMSEGGVAKRKWDGSSSADLENIENNSPICYRVYCIRELGNGVLNYLYFCCGIHAFGGALRDDDGCRNNHVQELRDVCLVSRPPTGGKLAGKKR
jgi:hypothetical protein